jgi:hypothetical protein
VTASTDRRHTGMSVLWSAPVLAAAVACSCVWRLLGPEGAVLFAFGMTAVCAAAAWWGAPPWQSRMLSAQLVGRAPTRHVTVQAVTAGVAMLLMGLAPTVRPGAARDVLVWVGAATGETAVAMALVGVRQWRFTPRRRVRECTALLLATLLLVVVCPGPLLEGEAWAVLPAAAALLVAVAIGARHARHADRASRAADVGARP